MVYIECRVPLKPFFRLLLKFSYLTHMIDLVSFWQREYEYIVRPMNYEDVLTNK